MQRCGKPFGANFDFSNFPVNIDLEPKDVNTFFLLPFFFLSLRNVENTEIYYQS